MSRELFRWSCVSALALILGGCGLARIPIEAPNEPIRIEATLVVRHEHVLLQPGAGAL